MNKQQKQSHSWRTNTPCFSLEVSYVLRGIIVFLIISTTLYFVGCSLPRSITQSPSFVSRGKELAIEPVTEQKFTVHPATHPVPARQERKSDLGEDPTEIKPEHILVAHVHDAQVNTLVVSHDGLRAFSGGQDGKVVLSTLVQTTVSSDSTSGAALPERFIQSEVILKGTKPILALALSPDETKLLIAQYSMVTVFNLQHRQITNKLSKVKGRILAVDWDPRGDLAALGNANGDVYVWNLREGPYAGQDSFDALESYPGSYSPIAGVLFYTSGRELFVAERGGEINLWRLLRTESELGLRDDEVEKDRDKHGAFREKIGSFRGEVEDIWLSPPGKVLFAAGADGSIYRVKIRGIKDLDKISVESSVIFSLQGLDIDLSQGQLDGIAHLLATSGKEQRIKFWCQSPGEGLIAQTSLLRNPPTVIRSGRSSAILWAGVKTGNLLALDANLLAKSPIWLARTKLCRN